MLQLHRRAEGVLNPPPQQRTCQDGRARSPSSMSQRGPVDFHATGPTDGRAHGPSRALGPVDFHATEPTSKPPTKASRATEHQQSQKNPRQAKAKEPYIADEQAEERTAERTQAAGSSVGGGRRGADHQTGHSERLRPRGRIHAAPRFMSSPRAPRTETLGTSRTHSSSLRISARFGRNSRISWKMLGVFQETSSVWLGGRAGHSPPPESSPRDGLPSELCVTKVMWSTVK